MSASRSLARPRRLVVLALGIALLMAMAGPAQGAKPSVEVDVIAHQVTNGDQCISTVEVNWSGAKGKYTNVVYSISVNGGDFFHAWTRSKTLNDGYDTMAFGQIFGNDYVYRVELVKGQKRVVAWGATANHSCVQGG